MSSFPQSRLVRGPVVLDAGNVWAAYSSAIAAPNGYLDDTEYPSKRSTGREQPFDGSVPREPGRLVSTSSFASFSATPNHWENPLITGQVRREAKCKSGRKRLSIANFNRCPFYFNRKYHRIHSCLPSTSRPKA
jgi:hypothetical protein